MDKIEEAPWLYPLIVDYSRRKVCECKGTTYLLDGKNRLVYCQKCGAIIDPFEALLNMARSADRVHDYLNAYRELAEKERRAYERYKGVNDITRKARQGLIPVCPHCEKPVAPEKINTFINRRFAEEEEL